jgi:hypothetical protein
VTGAKWQPESWEMSGSRNSISKGFWPMTSSPEISVSTSIPDDIQTHTSVQACPKEMRKIKAKLCLFLDLRGKCANNETESVIPREPCPTQKKIPLLPFKSSLHRFTSSIPTPKLPGLYYDPSSPWIPRRSCRES